MKLVPQISLSPTHNRIFSKHHFSLKLSTIDKGKRK